MRRRTHSRAHTIFFSHSTPVGDTKRTTMVGHMRSVNKDLVERLRTTYCLSIVIVRVKLSVAHCLQNGNYCNVPTQPADNCFQTHSHHTSEAYQSIRDAEKASPLSSLCREEPRQVRRSDHAGNEECEKEQQVDHLTGSRSHLLCCTNLRQLPLKTG
jgi:hypothetical protein